MENLTEELLLSQGYKIYDNPLLDNKSDLIESKFFQKRITNEGGLTEYFINCTHYRYFDNGKQVLENYSFSAQLTPEGFDTINIETVQWFNKWKDTVKDVNDLNMVERLFSKIFSALNCNSID